MNILQIMKTMIAARGLEVLLIGKEVTTFDDASMGVVTAIKKDLSQDRIWIVIEHLGQESIMPIEQIAGVARKVVLFGDFAAHDLAGNGKLGVSSV